MAGLTLLILGGLFFTNRQFFNPGSNQSLIGEKGGQVESKLTILDGSSGDSEITKAQVKIELADTQEKRSKGLGGRKSLASDSGMLFVYEKADKYRFWMKDVGFPLDFVWIMDEVVVDISEDVPPPAADVSDDKLPVYSPVAEVNKVLETNAGFVREHGIKIGDVVKYSK